MTTEEAFIKVLQMHGIEHAFGIIGSAFMPISDLFPKAGITFWDVAHETNGGLIADGYTRATGKMSMVIAQNGPGITGLVTPIKTAYWNHTPLLLVTPGGIWCTNGHNSELRGLGFGLWSFRTGDLDLSFRATKAGGASSSTSARG